mgnify:CR=1 FL=1|jgi:hypothetical protein
MSFVDFSGTIPNRATQSGDVLSANMDNWVSWFSANAYPLAVLMASAGAGNAGAELASWVSAASYTEGDAIWSPADYQSYRAKTTHSGETTDPSSDATNWERFSVGSSPILSALSVLGTATFDGNAIFNSTITEKVYALTGTDLDPANGTMQLCAMSAIRTLTESLADGQSVYLRVTGGDTYALTLFTVSWLGGVAPSLAGDDLMMFWKENGTVYGHYAGSFS